MTIRRITKLAAVAALYVAFTIINPFSYDMVSSGYRKYWCSYVFIAALRLRPYYRLFLSLTYSGRWSSLTLFGSLATAISVMFIARSKNIVLASLYPVVFNAVIVGLELHYFWELPLLESMAWVALGEFVVVTTVGVILFKILEKNDGFLDFIEANQNLPQD